MRDFTSGFAADLNGMIDFKTAFGYAESTFIHRSRQFDCFCVNHDPEATVITEDLAVRWLRMDENISGCDSCQSSLSAWLRPIPKGNGQACFCSS